MKTPSESTLRRRALRHGERLIKVRENSRHYMQFGPYMLVDLQTNAVTAAGMELGDIGRCFPR